MLHLAILVIISRVVYGERFGSADDCSFIQATVAQHNRYRYRHGARLLRFSNDLKLIADGIVRQIAKIPMIRNIDTLLNTDQLNLPNGIGSNILSMKVCRFVTCCDANVTSIFYDEVELFSYLDFKSVSGLSTGKINGLQDFGADFHFFITRLQTASSR
jgi:hypothetical protein